MAIEFGIRTNSAADGTSTSATMSINSANSSSGHERCIPTGLVTSTQPAAAVVTFYGICANLCNRQWE